MVPRQHMVPGMHSLPGESQHPWTDSKNSKLLARCGSGKENNYVRQSVGVQRT